jgi:hypothetical protein
MERSSFFNSIGGDRKYKAEDWATYFSSFIGNGVFPLPSNGLQVVADSGMNIAVRAGKAWVNGYFYTNTSDLILTLSTADGVLNRIDRIVIRWDLTERIMSARVKSSAPATNPTAPPLQRDADAFELCIADVLVGQGVTSISQSNITDQRLNNNLCGMVAGVVQQIDTTTFNAQLQAWFNDYKLMSAADYADLVSYFNARKIHSDVEYNALIVWFNAFKLQSDNQFNAWFSSLQSILDESAVAHILSLVTNLTDRVTLIEAVLFNDIKANPFIIQFDNLNGVEITGIWNADLQRIEC